MLPTSQKDQKHKLSTAEHARLYEMMNFERKALEEGFALICGVDEAGRGPLAGPVVAAAVILPQEVLLEGINDSKLLTPSKREQLYQEIILNEEIHSSIAIVESQVIDAINILQATKRAMREAVQGLVASPDLMLVDGMFLDCEEIPSWKIIKGDRLSQSIAAASVLAKVTRDRIMLDYDKRWPEYGFARHKGYGTLYHREAIVRCGACPIHRFSFGGVKPESISNR